MGLLELLVLVLLIMWLGGVGTYGLMAAGGFIHVLLIIVLVLILVRFVEGRNL